MNNFLKTLIAGYGAKKLGGGCLSTILIFFVIYYVLGTCNGNRSQPQEPVPYRHGQHAQLLENLYKVTETSARQRQSI